MYTYGEFVVVTIGTQFPLIRVSSPKNKNIFFAAKLSQVLLVLSSAIFYVESNSFYFLQKLIPKRGEKLGMEDLEGKALLMSDL